MNKKIFRKVIKVIAIIAAYFISMIGSAIFAGGVLALLEEKKRAEEKSEVKTEVKKTEEKNERSDERIIIKGFSRTE